MTLEATPALPARLSFGTTFSAGFSTVFSRFWMFIKAALLPVGLSILIGLGAFALAAVHPALAFPLQILGMLPLALLGIACCRLALIGRQAGAIPRPLFGRRTWVYFGYNLLFMLFVAGPMIVVGFAMLGGVIMSKGGDPDSFDPEKFAAFGIAVLLIFPFYFVYLYFITRISLVFPAVSVDQKLGLGGSWRLTCGAAGFKLYAVFVLLTIALIFGVSIVIGVMSAVVGLIWFVPGGLAQDPADISLLSILATQAPVLVLSLLLEYLGFVIMIAALASAYAQLSGWGGPRAEILERFE
ncbi:MAG: hypothetical protein RH942_09040 [Kiloniellaceae bacterium]